MFAQKFFHTPTSWRSYSLFSVFFLSFLTFLAFGSLARQDNEGSSFTARLVNLEAETKDPFRFNATLRNGSGETQMYALKASVPNGWTALFRVQGSQVAGLRLEPGATQDISIEIKAAPLSEPGKYEIPVTATANDENLQLDLEAVVKGNYQLEVTTPSGRLNDEITEGKSKQIILTVRNTGTLPLEELEFSAKTPSQWTATFQPSDIQRLEAGESQEVTATLSVPDKTIAGDYLTTFTARNDDTNAETTFRMTVKTSLLSGWIGILVILAALGMVYYLVRKYGRR